MCVTVSDPNVTRILPFVSLPTITYVDNPLFEIENNIKAPWQQVINIKAPWQQVYAPTMSTCAYTRHDILNACTDLSGGQLPWFKGKWKPTWKPTMQQNMFY